MKYLFLLTALCFIAVSANAKTRITVLPFENMDGKLELNVHAYDLRDSLISALVAEDPNSEFYEIVDPEDVEDELAEMNLDPTNPQYKTDLWKVINKLKIKMVVMGNFNKSGDYLLINAYIYNPKMKLPLPDHQAKDIFKKEDEVLSAIEEIKVALLPGLKP